MPSLRPRNLTISATALSQTSSLMLTQTDRGMSDNWLTETLDRLPDREHWGYRPAQAPAVEPAAFAALALLGHGREAAAKGPLEWLVSAQRDGGRVCSTSESDAPGWGTAMAIVAWQTAQQATATATYQTPIERGLKWLLSSAGKPQNLHGQMAHDGELVGWPWIGDTHSWLEPTAWTVLAFRAVGRGNEPRIEVGIKILQDRLLPSGGANYGNTIVLGHELLPHVQPTGLALLTLAGVPDRSQGKLAAGLKFLRGSINAQTTAASLAYAAMGLAAHQQLPTDARSWLGTAASRAVGRGAWLPRVSLLALAALEAEGPLLKIVNRRGAA